MKNYMLIIAIFLSQLFFAQELAQKRLIEEYGDSYEIPFAEFRTDTLALLKVVFDVSRPSENQQEPNEIFVAAARFLNMHYNAGANPNNLKIALVVHGAAANDVLNSEAFLRRTATANNIINPNEELLTALAMEGVEIILCGQTAVYRDIKQHEVHPEVRFSLSAMTALVQLQKDDYYLINFN
ncbi:DsrE family protein [Autumnicola psychrophila]|uniref:DsrE family protein n=1 Tax=Autumnicola psychrophila TaxID=3075592 RepID=A0ABU3DTK7_9FLAO|nr:DsrE family protein [Zunongwangia sp. F225]MDT0687049.1 DsrE family protein [Zunongwangia sp. F225]